MCWGLLVPEWNSRSACRKRARVQRLVGERVRCDAVRSRTCVCVLAGTARLTWVCYYCSFQNDFSSAKALWSLWGEWIRRRFSRGDSGCCHPQSSCDLLFPGLVGRPAVQHALSQLGREALSLGERKEKLWRGGNALPFTFPTPTESPCLGTAFTV